MSYITVTVDVDVEIDRIISDLTDSQKQKIALHIMEESPLYVSEFNEKVSKLLDNQYKLSNEDVDAIMKIADKIP